MLKILFSLWCIWCFKINCSECFNFELYFFFKPPQWSSVYSSRLMNKSSLVQISCCDSFLLEVKHKNLFTEIFVHGKKLQVIKVYQQPTACTLEHKKPLIIHIYVLYHTRPSQLTESHYDYLSLWCDGLLSWVKIESGFGIFVWALLYIHTANLNPE